MQGVILLGFFLYIWAGIGPHLLYYGFGVFTAYPVVSLEGSSLRLMLSAPGGTSGVMAALLAQSYRSDWLGALTITGVLGALLLGIQYLLRSAQVERFRDMAWVPLLLALTIYNHHYENPLPVLLAIGLSVWTAILYGALGAGTLAGRAGLFVVLFAALYYLTGASAFVFAGTACLAEALLHRKTVLAIVQAALAAGGAFVLGRFVFGLGPQAIYTAGTPWDPSNAVRFTPLSNWLALCLHAFVPCLILVAFLGRIQMEIEAGTRARHKRRKQGPRHARERKQTSGWRADARVWMGLRMLVVAVTVALFLTFTRTHIRYERMLHYHAQNRDWDRVLALADHMRGRHSFTRSGVFDINRALAHQGRLGSELCVFPQSDIGTLLMSFDDMPGRLQHAKSLELYLDLGCLNAAEKNAYELLDHEGPSPPVLEAMVRIHLAKGQYESARVVFQALKKCVGCREYVRRWQPVMADPAQVETDALVQSWRRMRPTRDHTSMGVSQATLKRLVQENPGHRLAFEYLMASYLLRHQRVELMSHLSLLKPLGYTQLPRHYAEALLVHSLETGTPVQLQGWAIGPDVQSQFREIRSIVTRVQRGRQAVFDALAPKYGNTYMFYSMFEVCGIE